MQNGSGSIKFTLTHSQLGKFYCVKVGLNRKRFSHLQVHPSSLKKLKGHTTLKEMVLIII